MTRLGMTLARLAGLAVPGDGGQIGRREGLRDRIGLVGEPDKGPDKAPNSAQATGFKSTNKHPIGMRIEAGPDGKDESTMSRRCSCRTPRRMWHGWGGGCGCDCA